MRTALYLAAATALVAVPVAALAQSANQNPNASIFIRYQYDVKEILQMLEQAQGKPLSPQSVPARWLDEMGWRRWVREYQAKPFQLTREIRAQLLAQARFLKASFSYRVGDAVWVPAEAGEQPYGHAGARVNPRGRIARIVTGEKETYFVVEVGVDNGAQGGMRQVPGTYYDGSPGQVLDYGDNFEIAKKTYVYSLSEIDRYNGPFRSQHVGSDTGIEVDYTRDQKWLAKMDDFKNKVVAENLEVDFTRPKTQILAQQRRLIVRMFNHFKMNRNAPGGRPLLGDMANGGGACFQQACVLSHGVHAVGEPWGIKAMNISGQTVNPMGGHGFVRLIVRGPEEVHVYDMVRDPSGRTRYRGMEIRSNVISYISDPGWADYGKTPDFFAAMNVEDAINPKPVDANRAVQELIQGKSFEEVVVKYGNKGPMTGNQRTFRNEWFKGSAQAEFLAPRSQIVDAARLEKELGGDLGALVDEAKKLKARILAEPTGSVRGVKSAIYTQLVEPRAARLRVSGLTADGVRVILTEYLFRAVK